MSQITTSAPPPRRRLASLLGCVVVGLAVVALVWWRSSIYDRRVAELGGNGDEVAFYPDVFWPLLAGGCVFAVVVAWIVLRPETTLDRIRAWLVIAFVALGGVVVTATAVRDWFDPKPRLVLTRDELRCGNRFRWADISDLTFVSSRRSAAVRFQRQDAASRSRNEFFYSCSISGLSVPPADVFAVIHARWLAAGTAR
jgi:hypothetical protein